MKKNIVILGSTGSIGKSAQAVLEKNKDIFKVKMLVAANDFVAIKKQLKIFKGSKFYLSNASKIAKKNPKYIEKSELKDFIASPGVDIVIAAISGSEGLELIHHSINSGKRVLIANKEPLVMAGDYLMNLAKKKKAEIIPIDSEHCAVHQCISGLDKTNISKITLTCSGGPFLSWSSNKFKKITPNQALNHPIWKMGKKISVDSATLMNKALEIIEAKYLFSMPKNKIEAIIHPEGVVHALVELKDRSVLASLANPDMRLPIAYGLSQPDVVDSNIKRLNLTDIKSLSFEEVNHNKFPSINYAHFALKYERGMPIVLNSANEVAVDAFLKKEITFDKIFKLIDRTMSNAIKSNILLSSMSIKNILNLSEEAKILASEIKKKI